MTDAEKRCVVCKEPFGPNHPLAQHCVKQTDANQIARGIAEKIADIIWELPGGVDIRQKGVNLISAALIEYGEACAKDEKTKTDIMHNFYKVAIDQRDRAESKGYRRGKEEVEKLWQEYNALILNDLKHSDGKGKGA